MSSWIRKDRPQAVAARWYVRATTRSLTDREQRRLDAWLAHDPAHLAAWDNAAAAVGSMAEHRYDLVISQMRAEALRGRAPARPPVAQRGFMPAFAAAAAVVVLAVLVFPSWLDRGQVSSLLGGAQIYATGLGERSSYVLSDRSEMSLNTASRVRVTYSDAERRIELLEGEAHFDVAPMPSRPFVVHAAGRTVTALGTSFDVRLPADGAPLQVTLLEGHVRVDIAPGAPLAAATVPTELRPGDRFVARTDGAGKVERVDLARASAWRDGRLVVENVELADLVREANRYSRTKLVIVDPKLAALKVGGVFKAGPALGIAETLAEILPVQYRIENERIVLLPRS